MQSRRILLIDDDPDDAALVLEMLKLAGAPADLAVAENGLEALKRLREQGLDGPRLPDLILLDLNMPVMDGHAVLSVIKNDDRLRLIPVVMFTTSNSEEEIDRCYRAGANCFIAKPARLEEFARVMGVIEAFWFDVAKLPNTRTRTSGRAG